MTLLPTREQTPQIPPGSIQPRRPAPAPTRGGGPGAGASGGVSGREIIRTLRRRKWLILSCVAAWTAAAFVTTFLWAKYAPVFTASATITVSPRAVNPLAETERMFAAADMERVKTSYVRMLGRQSVLQRAIEGEKDTPKAKRKIQNTEWFQRDPDSAMERLMAALDVSAVRQSNDIEVSVTGRASTRQQRVDLAEIATAVAEAFVEETRLAASAGRKETIDKLDEERKLLEEDLQIVRTRMETVRKTNVDVVDLRERTGAMNATLTALSRERIELDGARVQAQTEFQTLQGLSDREKLTLPAVVLALQQDPQLPALRSTEVSYANELESVSRKFGPRHRTVRDYATRLTNVQTAREQREKKVVSETLEALATRFKTQSQAAQARLVEVGEKINEVKRQIRDLQTAQADLAQDAAKETSLVENIQRINDRLLDLRLIRKQEQPVALGGQAETPLKPSMPRWGIMMPLGVLLGLAMGLALTFLLEFLDTSVKTPADVARRTGLALLGTIPHADDVDEDVQDIRLPTQTAHSSLIVESFREVRTSLMFSGPPEQRRTLMVTSAQPRDGRTTVAVNLAAAMAREQRSVLVVDANFHQPALGPLFSPGQEAGLSDALGGGGKWQDLVAEVEENLHVLPAGPMPPNPGELLGSQAMRDLIGQMLDQYDQVILDTAPCLVVSDAVVLGAAVNGVIFVVRAGVNTHGIVQRAQGMFRRVGARVLGGVLNGMRITAGGYLRKNYETFYRYSKQGKSPPAP